MHSRVIRSRRRLQQEARGQLGEHLASRPDEVYVHLLCNKDLPVYQELVMQQTWRHRQAGDPELAVDAVKLVWVELLLDAGGNITAGSG